MKKQKEKKVSVLKVRGDEKKNMGMGRKDKEWIINWLQPS